MAYHGAAANLTRLLADIIEIRNSMNIDQIFRPRDPQFHHRHQTLTTRKKLRVLPMLLQKRDRFADATRLQIFKHCWIHRKPNSERIIDPKSKVPSPVSGEGEGEGK